MEQNGKNILNERLYILYPVRFPELLLTKLLPSAGKYATLSVLVMNWSNYPAIFLLFPKPRILSKRFWSYWRSPVGEICSFNFSLSFCFNFSYLYLFYNNLHSFWLYKNWAIGFVKPRKSLTLCFQSWQKPYDFMCTLSIKHFKHVTTGPLSRTEFWTNLLIVKHYM